MLKCDKYFNLTPCEKANKLISQNVNYCFNIMLNNILDLQTNKFPRMKYIHSSRQTLYCMHPNYIS